jgi:hypothetical protein
MSSSLDDFDFEDGLLVSLTHVLSAGRCVLVVDCWSVSGGGRTVIDVEFQNVFMARSYSELPFRPADSVLHALATSKDGAQEIYSNLHERGPYKVLKFTIGGAERSVDLEGIQSESDILVARLDAIGLHLELACRNYVISTHR